MQGERGVALVITTLVMLLLLGLSGALIPLATLETQITANHRRSVQLLYAAESALDLAVQELESVEPWRRVLREGLSSGVWSRPATLQLANGDLVNLTDLTDELNRSTGVGPTAVWTLAGAAQLHRMVFPAGLSPPQMVAVWLGDDAADTDGDPMVDSNNRLRVYAEAYGAVFARRSITATVGRLASGRVSLMSWRVAR